MPNYLRNFIKGGTFFFTVVTYMRYPIFEEDSAISLLTDCFNRVIKIYPFEVDAIAILPDHLHTIWTLPDGESDFSLRWKQIKSSFSRGYLGPRYQNLSESMYHKGEKGIWQRRFWEHTIRDQTDFNRHCDYIHYNPVKHGLTESPLQWKYSSFEKFVQKGLYPNDWGKEVTKDLLQMNCE